MFDTFEVVFDGSLTHKLKKKIFHVLKDLVWILYNFSSFQGDQLNTEVLIHKLSYKITQAYVELRVYPN